MNHIVEGPQFRFLSFDWSIVHESDCRRVTVSLSVVWLMNRITEGLHFRFLSFD